MDNPELKTTEWKELCRQLKRDLAPICWYCGTAIDLKISGRLPLGWTLDHIKPRWSHPHLVYERSNLRPAHHKCNSERGGKTQTATASRNYG